MAESCQLYAAVGLPACLAAFTPGRFLALISVRGVRDLLMRKYLIDVKLYASVRILVY
jgi:hypothetical protein